MLKLKQSATYIIIPFLTPLNKKGTNAVVTRAKLNGHGKRA
jgi:hypothetical protein